MRTMHFQPFDWWNDASHVRYCVLRSICTDLLGVPRSDANTLSTRCCSCWFHRRFFFVDNSYTQDDGSTDPGPAIDVPPIQG